jgi:hypothetical protein
MTSYEQPLIHAIGWSLLHFLWEGAIVALLLTSTLRLLSNRSSQLWDALAYAKALSFLEERRGSLAAAALGANGGVLAMRIKRLLAEQEQGTQNYKTTIMTRKDIDMKFVDACHCGEFQLQPVRN